MNYAQNYIYPQMTPIQSIQGKNNGLITVRNEMEARNYPVAYGNSVTFKDENAPYIYTKTMGFSQLDRPIFEKFKLVKEEVDEDDKAVDIVQHSIYTDSEIKSKFEEIWEAINGIKERIDNEYEPA